MASELGLSGAEIRACKTAGFLHDIGMIGVPDHILLKPGRLSAAEWAVMRSHTGIGYEILKDSQSSYLQAGAEIAICHHERFDGGGYPFGMKGKDIPIAARIVAVADIYDAIRSARPYKPAFSHHQAVQVLLEGTPSDVDIAADREAQRPASTQETGMTTVLPASRKAAACSARCCTC